MATTTPNYGWDVPTSTDYVKDGATAIETLGDDIDATLYTALGGAYPGLRLVKKQTIGSAVSSVTVTSAFSATYDNYIIKVSGGANSSFAQRLSLTLGSINTGYYAAFPYLTFANAFATGSYSNNSVFAFAGIATTNGMTAHIDVLNPFLAMRTMFMADYFDNSGAGRLTGFVDSSTSQTAFTLTTTAGTMTGGTIYVYGYGAS
jgi:hypothetical protein